METKFKPGADCSPNFVFKKQIETFNELYEILETQPSIFWRHRIYPTAVLKQQKLCLLSTGIKYGIFWEIEKKRPILAKINDALSAVNEETINAQVFTGRGKF